MRNGDEESFEGRKTVEVEEEGEEADEVGILKAREVEEEGLLGTQKAEGVEEPEPDI